MEQPITADDISRDLIHFIAKSPSTFHAVRGIKAALLYAGFTEIREEDTWQIEKGGKYVVTRNGSTLMAFTAPSFGTVKAMRALPFLVTTYLPPFSICQVSSSRISVKPA